MTQGTGTHRQHRIIEGAVEGFAHRANTGEWPGLGDETTGAVNRSIDRTARYFEERQHHWITFTRQRLSGTLYTTVQVSAAVEPCFEDVGDVALFLVTEFGWMLTLQEGAITFPGIK